MSGDGIRFRIIRSGRRSLSLSVGRDGSVLVRAPFRRSADVIKAFVDKNRSWIEERKKAHRENARAGSPLTGREIAALRKEADRRMPRKAKRYADLMGVSFQGIKITSAKTRWGSCSGKNSICFSYRIRLLRDDLQDYIALHEVCHIKQKNHSPAFYRLVSRIMPDYKEREKRIKDFPNADLY